MATYDDRGAHAPEPVQCRLFRYAGCTDFVYRWFITSDAVPMPYRTREEALQAYARRRWDGEALP